MKVEILDKTKKKKVMDIVSDSYGISKLPQLFIKTGKDKVRIFSGGLSWDEINELGKAVDVQIIGVPLCTFVEDNVIRLNFDIINFPQVKLQINKNIFEISNEQLGEWLKGRNIEVLGLESEKITKDFLVIKHNSDFVGVGKNRESYIQNYVPKERRVRS